MQISSTLPNYENIVDGEFAFGPLVTVACKIVCNCIN